MGARRFWEQEAVFPDDAGFDSEAPDLHGSRGLVAPSVNGYWRLITGSR